MRATPRATFSSAAVSSLSSATAFPLAANGSPTRRWKRNSRPKEEPDGSSRYAVSAPLALLHHSQGRGDRQRAVARGLHFLPGGVMPRERLYLFDTTLRDGAQTNGVDFTLHDKLKIAAMLDDLGVDYVEGGYPGANPIDSELFAKERGLNTTFTAFGMTRRPGRSTSNDPGLVALLEA